MKLDIVLLPPEAVCNKIGQTMRRLKRNTPFNFIVDNLRLKPHISLLHLKADKRSLGKILLAAGRLAATNKKIKMPTPHFHKGRKFLVAGFNASKQLYQLHEKIVKIISPFRNGVVDLPFGEKIPLQKKYIKIYGVRTVLEFYKAHITLGWVKKDEDMLKVFTECSHAKFKGFTASRLAVTLVNKNNQVIKVIKEFILK